MPNAGEIESKLLYGETRIDVPEGNSSQVPSEPVYTVAFDNVLSSKNAAIWIVRLPDDESVDEGEWESSGVGTDGKEAEDSSMTSVGGYA
jgi:hypothetical protein